MKKDLKINIILLSFLIVVFSLFTWIVFSNSITEIDDYFLSINHPNFSTKIFTILTYLGNWRVILFAVLLIAILSKNKKIAFRVIASFLLVVVLCTSTKFIFARIRPFNMLVKEIGYSYPSFHACIAVAFYGSLCEIFLPKINKRYLKILLIAITIFLIIFIGFTRIYLMVHYFTDVIAGLTLGLICLVFTNLLYCIFSKLVAKNL